MASRDPKAEFDPLSVIAVVIKLWHGAEYLTHATGFLWRHQDEIFLVSNWHVFSGCSAHDGAPLDRGGRRPDRIETIVHLRSDEGRRQILESSLDIVDDGRAIWFQHPTLGPQVDVAAIPFTVPVHRPQDLVAWNDIPETPDMAMVVGQDIFALGYPLKPSVADYLPIWKRGTIATEPESRIGSLPKLLIDSATRPGMSGSPVLVRTIGQYLTDKGDFTFWSKIANRRVGVYSGRLGADMPEGVQLGVVWRIEVVDQICAGRAPGMPTSKGER